MSLGLVLPLYNEEALIQGVVADILTVLKAAKIPAELVLVNGMVLAAVVLSLLVTTRRALGADLATVLKGE